jgi:hypothetical protein
MSDDPGAMGERPDEPLSGMFQRIFRDPEFADLLETDPEQALREAGFELDEGAVEELQRLRTEQREFAPAMLPAVAVAVRIATSPGVRAGTAPVVSVATRTQIGDDDQKRFARQLEEQEKKLGEDS